MNWELQHESKCNMTGHERSDDLRRRLKVKESILMPGVWDPLSALIVQQTGFSTAFVSGFAVSGTLLGRPDVGYLTQTEMAEVAQRVCTSVPDLNVVVEKKDVGGKSVFVLNGGKLAVCLEDELNQAVIDAVVSIKPEKVLCLDKSFGGNDQLKTNAMLQMEQAKIDFKVI